MKETQKTNQRNTRIAASCLTLMSLFLLYVGCGQGFLGKSGKKPTPQKEPTTQVISPNERDSVGNGVPPTENISTSGSGSSSGEPTVRNAAISLQVIQVASESWWKNCLYAKTKFSQGWTKVSCNKNTGSVSGNATVNLPGVEGECNQVQLKIETFQNKGNTCAERHAQGLSCEGPYGSMADHVRTPSSNTSRDSHFRTYESSTIISPDPLIRSNASWTTPDFQQLSGEMKNFEGQTRANTWLRVYFEDKPSSILNQAISNISKAVTLGVDFNDYVLDLKGENMQFTVEGSGVSCAR